MAVCVCVYGVSVRMIPVSKQFKFQTFFAPHMKEQIAFGRPGTWARPTSIRSLLWPSPVQNVFLLVQSLMSCDVNFTLKRSVSKRERKTKCFIFRRLHFFFGILCKYLDLFTIAWVVGCCFRYRASYRWTCFFLFGLFGWFRY